MADDFNNDSLLELYLYELTSLLESLDDILLNAEASGSLTSENINEIFRVMHTIKGSSSMMAFTGIADVAHKTEELFAAIRSVGIDTHYFNELFDVVLAVSDFLKGEAAKIQANAAPETEVGALTAVVANLTEKVRGNAPDEPAPDSGRVLGAPVAAPVRAPEAPKEPAPVRAPEAPEPAPLPEAPEGGRILGLDPSPESARPQIDDLAADLSKITERTTEAPALPGETTTYYLHIYFNEGSKMENIRAFMLVNKLNEKGVVNRTIPAAPENDPDAAAQIIERGFYASYSTTLFREQVETLIRGTLSVETISFVRRLPDDPQGAEALPAPELRPQPIAASPKPIPATSAGGSAPDHAPTKDSAPGRPVFVDVTKPSIENAEIANGSKAPGRPVFVDVTQRQAQANTETLQPPQAIANTNAPQLKRPALPAAEPHEPTGQAHLATNQNFISVELKKLDTLLDLVGEIVISELIVTENPDLAGLELTSFNKAAHHLNKLTGELQDTVMSIRMLQVSLVFQRMRRVVRDMNKALGKDVDLILVGETIEVDKTILDALTDPLMHLVRNAMDHAIESAEERTASGKGAVGHIVLSAQNSGGDVIISVSDDGKGLDKALILNKARATGFLRKPESEYSDKEVFNLLMAPGFSTRDAVSEYSGRGVGLDVVKSNIEKVGGSVIIESKKGVGTNIIMKIPLTLAIISCIEISIGKDIYAIPINNIREAFKSGAGQLITEPNGGEMIMLRGAVYPIVRLYERFGCVEAITDIEDGILVLAETGDDRVCFLADSLIGKFQVVVKPLPAFLNRFGVKHSGISGCTIMGNGNIGLIVNVQDFVE